MRRLRPKAFTLVEVLCSIVILAGAIVGVILCNTDGLAMSENIEQKVKSTLLAESEMEQIKGSLAQDFNQLWGLSQSDLGENLLAHTSVLPVAGRPELKLVEVSVGHDTNSNASLASDEIMFTLATWVAERE